jgi:hypothetical protein
VNSEELEQSLRTEFESYLKNVLADMRQEVAEFQKQFEAEFEKHKAQLDEVFQNFAARVAADREMDSSFSESVVEHLRLSRDEGARITAMAIAEAEELEKQNAAEAAKTVEKSDSAPTRSLSEIRDAVNDISSKTTQSAILKTLVNHASRFTPRGAFFIIKNEHLVGWRVFGTDGETVDEQAVREIFFPVASSTVLGEAVRSLAAVESAYGAYTDDSTYLNQLAFGQPEQMFAVPLVVRGRSVAVLYADPGADGGKVDIDALETLVRVASMTVEILASARGMQPQTETSEEANAAGNTREAAAQTTFSSAGETASQVEENPPVAAQSAQAESSFSSQETAPETEKSVEEEHSYTPSAEAVYAYQPVEQPADSFETPNYQTSYEGDSFSFKPNEPANSAAVEFVSEDSVQPVAEYQAAPEEAPAFDSQPAWSRTVESDSYYAKEPAVTYESPSFEPEGATYDAVQPQTVETEASAESEYAPVEQTKDYQFEAQQPFEAPVTEFDSVPQTYETPAYGTPQYKTSAYEAESFAPSNSTSFEPIATQNGKAESYAAETAAEAVIKQPAKSRFSERNVDLPIEVSEEERQFHNDARRFARLLVSEIKLYNEQKVKDGRESSDLYERLREAIDRSREMYDKRVKPTVAAKFDYFHYELVNNLAEGDADKLGDSYPGADV